MINQESFPALLTRLRERANLTNRELAEIADVLHSIIAGVQSGKRRIGEYQGHKIGVALGLKGDTLEDFVLLAINTCKIRVLSSTEAYPSELINFLAMQLRSLGIFPEHLRHWEINRNPDSPEVNIQLNNGRKAQISTKIAYA